MQNLVFLDTETTGNDLLKDHLFQVCYAHNGNTISEYFKPPLPISIKAQSLTHVTNKMVEDKSPFKGSKMQKDLQKLLANNILVAHNAAFDICMLSKEGIEVPKFICTLKVARFLDEECKIPEHNLQYLRYYLELEIDADSHDAVSDVLVLEALFNRLFSEMLEKYKDEKAVLDKMIEVSLQPSLYKVLNFGKYKGRRIEEISTIDKRYLEWLLNEKIQKGDGEEDWVFTLKHYLKIK